MSLGYAALFHALEPELALVIGALAVLGVDIVFCREMKGAHLSVGGRAGRPARPFAPTTIKRSPERAAGPAAQPYLFAANSEMGSFHRDRLRIATALGIVAVGAAIALVAFGHIRSLGEDGGAASSQVFGGLLATDSLAIGSRLGVLALTLLVLGIASGANPTRHPAEYVALMLFAATGLILMCAAQQLLLVFLALELASLSLYVLAGFDQDRLESAEAALKYFLVGGMAAAFLLFGFSLIYGLTGSIELPRIAAALGGRPMTPLLAVALAMVLLSFGFKTAAAPFHLWAPDAYQGAPAPAAALIASASKLASFALFARLLWPGLGKAAGNIASWHGGPGWLPLVGLFSAASLLVGNLGALVQTDVRRLLAYSAIAHAGALLLGVMAAGVFGTGPLFYYAATYGIAAAGAFGVIAILDDAGGCRRISDLAGLHRRSPLLAGCLLIFILSLAGVPPLAGFYGKFAVFAAAIGLGGLSTPAGCLAAAAIFLSAVALYYYLIVLKNALVLPPAEGAGRVAVPPLAGLCLVIAAVALILLGLFPGLVT